LQVRTPLHPNIRQPGIHIIKQPAASPAEISVHNATT
jgi:hypothetical protein